MCGNASPHAGTVSHIHVCMSMPPSANAHAIKCTDSVGISLVVVLMRVGVLLSSISLRCGLFTPISLSACFHDADSL